MQISWLSHWPAWSVALIELGVALALAWLAHGIVFRLSSAVAQHRAGAFVNTLVAELRQPAGLLLPALLVLLVLPEMPLPKALDQWLRHAIGLVLIGSFAWLINRLLHALGESTLSRFPLDVADNLEARRIRTQVVVLRRIGVVFVDVLALGFMLWTFPAIRHVGTGLFASAGLVGLAAGMAARPLLTNVIAGLQIAMTQPIRIDDAVIVEGEWGWIEEIRATFVVVRIWDLRRLVVPIAYFIEKPFQNWTRTTADLLGAVILYVDYTVPVEDLRRELKRILDGTPLWDQNVWGLQVTDASDTALQVRALMSARDAPTAWDLRCLVREKLVEYLQKNHPGSLPKTRAELYPATPSRRGDEKSAAA